MIETHICVCVCVCVCVCEDDYSALEWPNGGHEGVIDGKTLNQKLNLMIIPLEASFNVLHRFLLLSSGADIKSSITVLPRILNESTGFVERSLQLRNTNWGVRWRERWKRGW